MSVLTKEEIDMMGGIDQGIAMPSLFDPVVQSLVEKGLIEQMWVLTNIGLAAYDRELELRLAKFTTIVNT